MVKKIIAIISSLVISASLCGISVSAESLDTYNNDDISLMYLYTYSCSSILSISNSTATCSSNLMGYVGETTKISVTQTLQKKNSKGEWDNVTSWSSSANSYKLNTTNYKYNLTSETYQLVSKFTIYAGNEYETITKISNSVIFKS